jgi:hypothetical protein
MRNSIMQLPNTSLKFVEEKRISPSLVALLLIFIFIGRHLSKHSCKQNHTIENASIENTTTQQALLKKEACNDHNLETNKLHRKEPK